MAPRVAFGRPSRNRFGPIFAPSYTQLVLFLSHLKPISHIPSLAKLSQVICKLCFHAKIASWTSKTLSKPGIFKICSSWEVEAEPWTPENIAKPLYYPIFDFRHFCNTYTAPHLPTHIQVGPAVSGVSLLNLKRAVLGKQENLKSVT